VVAGVGTVTLDDPGSRNALSVEVLDGVIAALEAARGDGGVRVVVLASALERTFSSGANLAGFGADVGLVDKHEASARFVEVFGLLGQLGKPSIVKAGGHVLAGALGLVLACDLVVAGESATFGTPEIDVGAFAFMVMALLYRNVGRKKANELLLLGERIDAREAQRIGIVNRVVPDAQLDEAVAEWAGRLAGRSPVIMRLGKDAMYRQQDMAFADALDYLRSQLTIAQSTQDIVEGITAFFEKRQPHWTGR
jgi:enoyl-CoA hydratase/carnithine racemase